MALRNKSSFKEQKWRITNLKIIPIEEENEICFRTKNVRRAIYIQLVKINAIVILNRYIELRFFKLICLQNSVSKKCSSKTLF